MSKQNAEVLARTARSEAERITKGDKRTIAAIINNWNECVKQSGFWCIYDFPTTGYTRKSQLVADLLSCADQLDEYVEPNPHAAQTVEQQTREFNAALTRVLDVEVAHAEALEMNISEEQAIPYLAQQEFIFMSTEDKAMAISRDHAEALEMNAETDRRHHCSVMASLQKAIMERDDLPELVEACHAEALEMNSHFDKLNKDHWCFWNCVDLNTRILWIDGDHSEALEEDKRFTWLANRWSLFWAGCDYFTRRTMIEEAHTEALEIEKDMVKAHPQNNTQLNEVNALRIMYGTSSQIHYS